MQYPQSPYKKAASQYSITQSTPKIMPSSSMKNIPTADILASKINLNQNLTGKYKLAYPIPGTPARNADNQSAMTGRDQSSNAHLRRSGKDIADLKGSVMSGAIARSQSNANLPKARGEALIQGGARTMGAARGSTLQGAQSQKKIYGIEGYHMFKFGTPSDQIRYTIPKDKNSSMFKQITKGQDKRPGPAEHHKVASWKVNQKNFGLGPPRKTFTDEAEAHSKTIPAPTSYKIKYQHKMLLGQFEKEEGINYMSDALYLAKVQPGPEKYKPNKEWVKQRITSVTFNPRPAKENWRPKKTKDPDPGSYDVRKSQKYCGRSDFIHKFAHPRGEGVATKETFTTQATKSKKYIPGVGSYNPKMDFIAIPYSRKRGC